MEYLHERGYIVFPTREPGGTSIGEQIREVIHDLKNVEMPSTPNRLVSPTVVFRAPEIRPR
ncbi:MAG TPA: hypothetical protein VFY26_11115 [Anaerolineales bacterium]|nr:hypothetical protein [Anaerolineales bacterium]